MTTGYKQHWIGASEFGTAVPCTAKKGPCPACDFLAKSREKEQVLTVGIDFATAERNMMANLIVGRLIDRDPYIRALLLDSSVGLTTRRISSKANHSANAIISDHLLSWDNFNRLWSRKSRAVGVSEPVAPSHQPQKIPALQQFMCEAPHGVLTITLPTNWWK